MDSQEDVRFLRAATESEAGAGEVRESKFSDPRHSRSKRATSNQIFRVLFAARSFFLGCPLRSRLAVSRLHDTPQNARPR